MDFGKLIKDTSELNKKFTKKFDKRDRMLDLVEEVGELAQAMMIVDRRKFTNDPQKKRTKADIADALGDVLYDLILLAEDYEIDLEQEYSEMLDRLKDRVKKGEFDGR